MVFVVKISFRSSRENNQHSSRTTVHWSCFYLRLISRTSYCSRAHRRHEPVTIQHDNVRTRQKQQKRQTMILPVVKVVLWSGGGLTWRSQVWSKPYTHFNPTNLALFRHKITLYRFNQGAHTIAGRLKWERGGGAEPPTPSL